MSSTLFISAGEASGDAHAAALVRELLRRRPGTRVVAYGGPQLAAAGADVRVDLTAKAAVGITEIARNLGFYAGLLNRQFPALLREVKPDAAVLVDFSGFHLQAVKSLCYLGIPAVYFISPQIWASRAGRIRRIRERFSLMLCAFKFEQAIYERAGVPVEFVGHPIVDAIQRVGDPAVALQKLGLSPRKPIVVLMPGSRDAELRRHLPIVLEAAARMRARRPDLQFLLPVAPTLNSGRVQVAVGSAGLSVAISTEPGVSLAARKAASVALVKSGMSTLETALLGTPQVIFYRVSWPTYFVGRMIVRVPHVGMPNVIVGTKIAPEFVQGEATPEHLANEGLRLLDDRTERARIGEAYTKVREQVGGPAAAERAAGAVLGVLDRGRTGTIAR